MTSNFKCICRLLVTAVAILAALPSSAQKGETAFGAQLGYTSCNNSAEAGLFFQYGFSEHLRIAPDVGCVFRHDDEDAFVVDVNFHFPFKIGHYASTQIYPLCGVNYSSWTHHDLKMGDTDDVSPRSTKFGINLGAGFQFKTSPTLKLKLEAKYVLMEVYGTFVLSGGIGYVF